MKLPLAFLLACALMGCHARVNLDTSEREAKTYREAVDGTGAKELRAVIHMGAGKLDVGHGGPKVFEGEFFTNGARPKVRYSEGERARLEITQDGEFHLGDNENDWNLRYSDGVPMELELHLGAGEADLDLADLKLRRLVVHMGAGELRLDLRGKYLQDVDVEVHGGVGEARIRLPKQMRIDAEVSGGIGEIDVEGLEGHDGRYGNRASVTGGPVMRLEVHGGVGRIEVDAR